MADEKKKQDAMLLDAWRSLLGFALTNGAGALTRAFEQDDDALVAYVGRYDVMMAVWSDPNVESGFTFLPISGWDNYKAILHGVRDAPLRMMAIPTVDRDAAVKLLHRFGEPSWLDECLASESKPILN